MEDTKGNNLEVETGGTPSISFSPHIKGQIFFSKELTAQNKRLTSIEDAIGSMKKETDEKFLNFLKDSFTYLSIFGVIFTFISINITLFSKVDNLFQGIVFFTLFTWCLITLVYFIMQVVKRETSFKDIWLVPTISLTILFFGSLLAYKYLDGFTFKSSIYPTEKEDKIFSKVNHSLICPQ